MSASVTRPDCRRRPLSTRAKGSNRAAATALEAAFAQTKIITSGVPNGATRPGIDHIAISGDLEASGVWGWPNRIHGVRISDHDGAGADLTKTS
jgi:hypothetical protein